MTYELAKKLEESGFPQKGKTICKHGLSPNDLFGHLTPEYAAKQPDFVCTALTTTAPTLEELIEACRGRFSALSYRDHYIYDSENKPIFRKPWEAKGDPRDKTELCDKCHSGRSYTAYTVAEGDTPTEAVASLWLALKNANN